MVDVTADFSDLDYGDEVQRFGAYVGLPHDETNDSIPEGQAVTHDGTDIAAASSGDPVVGVLYTYQYYEDDGLTVDQSAPATVKTRGLVKAEVESSVSAGDALEAGNSNNGVFDNSGVTDASEANYIALTDAQQEDNSNPNGGTGENYAVVLLR